MGFKVASPGATGLWVAALASFVPVERGGEGELEIPSVHSSIEMGGNEEGTEVKGPEWEEDVKLPPAPPSDTKSFMESYARELASVEAAAAGLPPLPNPKVSSSSPLRGSNSQGVTPNPGQAAALNLSALSLLDGISPTTSPRTSVTVPLDKLIGEAQVAQETREEVRSGESQSAEPVQSNGDERSQSQRKWYL